MTQMPIDSLHEHYKMNVDTLKLANNKRDLMFLLLIISVMLIFVLTLNTGFLNSLIINLGKVDKENLPGNALLSTTFWLSSFILFIRYSQCCLFVEMQYKYISLIETEMNKHFSGTRLFLFESDFYKSNSSLYRMLVGFFYKRAFPSILILMFSFKIFSEINVSVNSETSAYQYLNYLVATSYVIYILAYLLRRK